MMVDIREHLRHHVEDEGGFCMTLDRQVQALIAVADAARAVQESHLGNLFDRRVADWTALDESLSMLAQEAEAARETREGE